MKTKIILLSTALIMSSVVSLMGSSKSGEGKDVKYRRSSLHMILIESDNFPRKETVIKAYNNAPFPDKYDDHRLEESYFDPNRCQHDNKESRGGSRGVRSSYTATGASSMEDPNEDDPNMHLIISKYLRENRIANKLVAKWFSRGEDGSFNMKLIEDRGFYNATEMEASIAKKSVRGMAALADAGIELINNTFVVVSKLNFVDNEAVASILREAAYYAAGKITSEIVQAIAIAAADVAYKKAKEGYSVWTTSYLYQLQWNDSIEAVFYNDLWMDSLNIDVKKREAFDETDLFQLKFLGREKATSLVLFSLKETRTEEQIIELATVRNIDAVYAKLQKKYDVFKPKIPLYTGYPITAKIGMKEGLKGGEKFEVLEQVVDPKTGLTKYVRKGKITVDKKCIWDNRYNAGKETEAEDSEVKFTAFKGRKRFYPGMLIRQLK